MNGFQALLLQITPILLPVLLTLLVGGLFYVGSNPALGKAQPLLLKFKDRLDRANIKMNAEGIGVGLFLGSAGIWAALAVLTHPGLIVAIIELFIVPVIVYRLFAMWVNFRIARRLASFNNQLEIVLRMMSSSIRAGLGLRQAIIMVTEEMPDPARYEFNLTIMQTNIGMSVNDALGRLAQRMPSQEMQMLTKAIAIQTQTGGNLGKTLDHLAATIKDRRKLMRKVKSITSEARGSAYVIGALPVMVSIAIMVMEPGMRNDLLNTDIGHKFIALAAGLEGLGIYCLSRMLNFKV